MRVLLTDRFCAGVKAKGRAQDDYFDERVSGLAFRVSEGAKSWILLFTNPRDNKRTRYTFARYPTTSLAAARGMALEAKRHIDEGADPRDGRAAAGELTVAGLVPFYIERPNKRTGKPKRTAREIQRRFERNVLPVIGAVKAKDLHRRDVQRVVQPIMRRGSPVEAKHAFGDLRALVRWAVGQGYLDHNIMDGMEARATSQPRERALDENEIQILWNGLPKALARSKACQRILKLCLVTAQRVGEVAGMSRDELDFKKAVWTIPGNRTKNGYEHRVPLSSLAVGIIKEALADAGDGKFVFPADGGSLSTPAVARTVSRANEGEGRFKIPQFSSHDLRRTTVTRLAELQVPSIVLAWLVNHRSVARGGITMSVYSQYDYWKERVDAMNLWAERLAAIVESRGAKVLPLRKK